MIKSNLINRPRVWLMRTFPRVYVKLARLAARGMFRKERAALSGGLRTESEGPSVLHFCYNRCGSRYVSSLIQRLLDAQRYEFVDFDRYHTHCNREGFERFGEADFVSDLLNPTGVHYGPFYRLHEGMQQLEDFKIVLTLRDPRDVLTSRFYSQAYAHTLFDRENVERRECFREMGVDAFVIDQMGEIIDRYRRFHRELMGKENVLFLPYEKMVGDFDSWLNELAEFLGTQEESEALRAIRAEANFSVKKEDKYSHRRSVKPGNHLQKLKPETIERLNEELAEVLEMFGYRCNGQETLVS